jgi:hypothetical protein
MTGDGHTSTTPEAFVCVLGKDDTSHLQPSPGFCADPPRVVDEDCDCRGAQGNCEFRNTDREFAAKGGR